MMNLLSKLKSQKNFSNNEQIIIDFILKNPIEILDMTPKELSQKCYVSVATIYRLCEKLNLSGFSDLKVKISNSIHNYQKENEEFDFDFPIKESQTHYEIINKLKEDYEKTLISTANMFNLDQLKFVVQAMKRAQYIDIYTSAGNIYFAENFKFQMKEIGVDVNVPVEEYQQRLSAACSDKNHLAIIISFGGRGLLINTIFKTLKDTHTPILLLSSCEMVTKDIKPDYHLYISPYENHYKKISSFSTRMSILYILDVLYTCYFEMNYQDNLNKKIDFYRIMAKGYTK